MTADQYTELIDFLGKKFGEIDVRLQQTVERMPSKAV